ncbi:50S ribosomal protein L11 methyltransferase [Staphylospora marina]|uniref:50S ribosomal protein L11 methyltransferase n=1 Tax=Staphylospora marina TaxID=2490858 RepID=UPI000F5BA2D5|nr:50S ribosomal protein L11 methyltransferase [Staphylospora marina]
MNWTEISVHVSREAQEAVSHLLQEMGADGVAIEDPEVLHRAWDSRYGEIVELNPDDYPSEGVIIRAYLSELELIDADGFCERVRKELNWLRELGLDPGPAEVTHRLVAEESWADEWKKYYRTVRVSDRLTIKPQWEDYTPSSPEEQVIELDPGMAFGTGTHPTTLLCLQMLEKHVRPGMRVIDVGCGSGVLSVAAAKLGAGRVLALDLDPLAVEKSRENVGLNRVEDAVVVRQGDLLRGVGETADLVVANILEEIIRKMAYDLPRVLVPGGWFIASGIIAEKAETVREALSDQGLRVMETVHQDGWVAITAKKW